MPDVTCVGVLVTDVLVRPVDSWPEVGRLLTVDQIAVRSGGLAHTTGVTLARLGVPTAVVGCVGRDLLGTFLLDVLHTHQIEAYVRRVEAATTSTTVVAVSSRGERSFLHLPGANTHLEPQDVPDALLAHSRILHLGGYFLLPAMDGAPAARLLARARAAGCRTSLDTAWDAQGRWMAALDPCLPHLDMLFGNVDELSRIAGTDDPAQIAAMLRGRGPQIVAVKLGEGGAYVDGPDWRGYVRAFSVEVVDTTGAGDAFCGGFLAAWLAGWDLPRTTRLANAAGAMCVTTLGGSEGIRSMDETLRFAEMTPLRA